MADNLKVLKKKRSTAKGRFHRFKEQTGDESVEILEVIMNNLETA